MVFTLWYGTQLAAHIPIVENERLLVSIMSINSLVDLYIK